MFEELCNIFSAGGAEKEMRTRLKELLVPCFDECYKDNFGNFIAHKCGDGKKVCIECGMDAPGVMAVHAEESKVRFTVFGGLTAKALSGKKIRFQGGAFGFVRTEAGDKSEPEISDLYIELADGEIKTGDVGTVMPEFCETERKIYAHGLSAYAALLASVKAARELSSCRNDIYFVFSAQKALGGRGIRAYFGVNEFDRVISVSACGACGGLKSGEGCGVAVKDKRIVLSADFCDCVEKTAQKRGIRHVPFVAEENLYFESFRLAGSDAELCGICVPVEFKGGAYETVYKSDIEDTARLVCALADEEGEARYE